MTAAATPKLAAFMMAGAAGIFLGLGTGQAELVTVAAPFVLAVVMTLAARRTPAITATLSLSAERLLEDEELNATVALQSDAGCEVEVGIGSPPALEPLEDRAVATVWLRPGEQRDVSFTCRTARWGAHQVGPIALRAHTTGRMIVFEYVVPEFEVVRVYPSAELVHRSWAPPETKSLGGDYTARSAGDGIEFATVRPFMHGDSVRRVNWRVTSRRGSLHVNLSHPERNAEVMLFLDTFGDVDLEGQQSTLDLTVRGAAAVAAHHLEHNDRVGLVGFGGAMDWLTASMGRTHAYRIADFLLGIKTYFSYAWKDVDLLPHGTLPPSALVVAFSPLVDERAVKALHDIAARGFSMVVVNTLAEDDVSAEATPEGELAYRTWKLRRELARAQFRANGVPVVTWRAGESLDAILTALPKRGRRHASALG